MQEKGAFAEKKRIGQEKCAGIITWAFFLAFSTFNLDANHTLIQLLIGVRFRVFAPSTEPVTIVKRLCFFEMNILFIPC